MRKNNNSNASRALAAVAADLGITLILCSCWGVRREGPFATSCMNLLKSFVSTGA